MNMESMVDSLAAIVPTDSDTHTGDDGLMYCNRCHTARQSRIEFLGRVKVVPCLCQCMAEERDRREKERKQQEFMTKVMSNRAVGFSDKELRLCTFDADDGAEPKLTNAMKAYVENFSTLRKNGKGLLLYGDVGTGKTFLAACVVNALIDRGYPCLMTNFSRLANHIAGMWEGIIDSLYRANVPMIITSNYTPKQLTETKEVRKKRVFDRMLERCHPIKVNGESRRKDMGRSDFAEMNKLLGL